MKKTCGFGSGQNDRRPCEVFGLRQALLFKERMRGCVTHPDRPIDRNVVEYLPIVRYDCAFAADHPSPRNKTTNVSGYFPWMYGLDALRRG